MKVAIYVCTHNLGYDRDFGTKSVEVDVGSSDTIVKGTALSEDASQQR